MLTFLRMQIAIAQLNQVVGDLAGNARAILDAAARSASAPARGWSSRPNCRCADTRRKTCCCGRRSSTPARASSARWRRRSRDVAGAGRVSGARRRQALQRARRCCATVASSRRLPQAAPAQLHGVRRGALLRAGQRALRLRRRRRALSASSSARTSGFRSRPRRRRRPARSSSSSPTARPTTRSSRRCGASRSARGRARPACRSSTSTGSAGRTNSCSTAPRSSSTRAATVVQQLPAWHETVGAGRRSTAARRKPVRGALDPRARAARLRRAGDGRARLRRQEPLSRRAARPVGRHRFGADAGRRRRRAGPRPGARA